MNIKSKIESKQSKIAELHASISSLECSLEIQKLQTICVSEDFYDEYDGKSISLILSEYLKKNKKALSENQIQSFEKTAEQLTNITDENAILLQQIRTDVNNKKKEITNLQSEIECLIQKDQNISEISISLFFTPIKHLEAHLDFIIDVFEKHNVRYSIYGKKIIFDNGLNNDNDIRNIMEQELKNHDKWFNFKSLSSKESSYIARKDILHFFYSDDQ